MTQVVGGPPFMPAADGHIYAKRQGAVATVFIDAVTGTSEALSDFEQDTMGFPYTCNEGELRAMFPGKVVFVDAPRPEQRIAKDALPAEEMDKAIRETMNGNAGAVPTPTLVPHPSSVVPVGDDTFRRVEEQFKLMLAKHSVASGKVKSRLKLEIENVASFLLQVEPRLESALQIWKEQANGRRFKL